MNSTIAALRAITAITMRRILVPVVWTIMAGLLLFYLADFYLISQASGWWGLLLLLLLPLTVIVLVVFFGLWWLTGRLLPSSYDKRHKKEIVAFTTKVLRLIETGKTPYLIHIFLIAKDVARGRESTHIRNVIDDSSSLKSDFDSLRSRF